MGTQETKASIPGPETNADGGSTHSGTDGLREARDRYRTERDAAREEVAAARARIERMQRAEVERMAADAGLAHASDVFTMSGNDLVDYLDDDGNVDPEKVATDVAAVLAERPGLGKFSSAFDPTQGTGGGRSKREEPSLAAMIKGTVADPWAARR